VFRRPCGVQGLSNHHFSIVAVRRAQRRKGPLGHLAVLLNNPIDSDSRA